MPIPSRQNTRTALKAAQSFKHILDPSTRGNLGQRNSRQGSQTCISRCSLSIAPEYSTLLKPIFTAFKELAAVEWDERWEHYKHKAYLKRIQPNQNSKAMDMFNGMIRSLCALLIQIRTGKIDLNDFLHSVDRAEINRCSCAGGLK